MAGLAPGTIVDGRYKIVSRLGAGGMADVFLAEDQQLGRKVALKLLYQRFAEDPGSSSGSGARPRPPPASSTRTSSASTTAARSTGTYYIAMEYLPGRSLKQLIREEAPLDPVRAIDITIQILKAARFAHRRGVIHRDLKPHNVIVDDADHAKVTDFGIARAGASDMTETGSIMGTAQYLSPEQAQGHAVSAGSDLYSIGVVLYEMLTGRVPFDAESAVTIALKHVSEAPPPPTLINPSIPPELEQVVLWALNKNPADRPPTPTSSSPRSSRPRRRSCPARAAQRTASMPALAAVVAGRYAASSALTAPADGAARPGRHARRRGRRPFRGRDRPSSRRIWPWRAAVVALLLPRRRWRGRLPAHPPDEDRRPGRDRRAVQRRPSAQLQNDGFNVQPATGDEPEPAGTVIAQDPLAGAKVKQGLDRDADRLDRVPATRPCRRWWARPSQQAKSAIQIANLKVGAGRAPVEHRQSPRPGDRDQPAGRRRPPGEHAGDDHRLDRAAAGEGARRDQRDRRPGEGAAQGAAGAVHGHDHRADLDHRDARHRDQPDPIGRRVR